jgi:hypothetical protein
MYIFLLSYQLQVPTNISFVKKLDQTFTIIPRFALSDGLSSGLETPVPPPVTQINIIMNMHVQKWIDPGCRSEPQPSILSRPVSVLPEVVMFLPESLLKMLEEYLPITGN